MAFRRNILLFHQGALGDFIVTWPLALAMARAFAQSRVFYVTAGQKGALAERALRVESIDVEGGWHHLFSESPRLPEAASRLLNGAQWIVNFVCGPDDLWARNVKALAPEAHLVTLSTTPPGAFSGHISKYLLEQLSPWPVVEAAMQQMLHSVALRGIGAGGKPDGPIVLHPGSGSDKKCWPADRFLELARLLAGRRVQMILGEVELERWPGELVERFSTIADVVRTHTLVDLMDRLCGASAFVGNDSGPGHLAGIMGLRTVLIFGPREPQLWKPLGPRVRVIHDQWDAITPGRVVETIARR